MNVPGVENPLCELDCFHIEIHVKWNKRHQRGLLQMGKFKLAVCQMKVESEKEKNLEKALEMIDEAARKGADMAVLPEMFICPYDNSCFPVYGESEDGEIVKRISRAAKANHIYIIAGSIPEKAGERIHNTSFIFDREGNVIGKHRKMHLFDIDVSGRIRFKESNMVTPGNGITVIDTEFCKIGVAICYDMRFPELIRLMALEGVKLIVIPAVFNMVTGPVHWEPTLRIRAIDNQVYLAGASTARNENASYQAYGHSMILDPWGKILASADEKEGILLTDIDLDYLEKVREELPLLKHRRTDVYQISKL